MSLKINIALAFCFLSFCFSANTQAEDLIVRIDSGQLKGSSENNMQVFKGIPYAAPPIGGLRWRPTQAPATWSGVRDASQFGAACPQPLVRGENDGLVPGNEDCLTLNVFAPKKAKNLPVMVWIHGGGLLVGSGKDPMFTPTNLVKNDVIVVTFNYRLGKFGVFAPKELIEEAKAKGEPVGNYATMDQIAVLKWVRKNIQAFGGDPNNVTIFGQSGGGRSITWLMVSEAARGHFDKAIAQSARANPLRGMRDKRFGMESEEVLDGKYMKTVGAKSLQELRSFPADKLAVTLIEFLKGEFNGAFIDGQILSGDPIPMFAKGQQAKVPFMIGTNSWDTSFLLLGQPSMKTLYKENKEDPKIINSLYRGQEECILSATIETDMWYRGGTKVLADSMNGIAPGYAYYFDYLTENIRPAYPGSPHSFELPYVFGSFDSVPNAPRRMESKTGCWIKKLYADEAAIGRWSSYYFPKVDKSSPQDRLMSEKMSSSWAAFARTGNPNVSGQEFWPIYSLQQDVMRHFSYQQETIKDLLKERVDYQINNMKRMFQIN